jgi:hypothetical protein
MPDSSEPGLLYLPTSIEIPELFKDHLRLKPLKLSEKEGKHGTSMI